MTHDHALPSPDTETDNEPHTSSPTAHVLDELMLYGYRPGQDEPDPRPLPEADTIARRDRRDRRRLRGHAGRHAARGRSDDLLWSSSTCSTARSPASQRDLDANEQAQRRSQLEQNGSEVRSVELERLIAQGVGLIERRNAFEFFRDMPPSATRPDRLGLAPACGLDGQPSHADLRDDRQPRVHRGPPPRRDQLLVPAGTRIAFTGGTDCNDHQRIWVGARPRPRQASRHGAAAWRLASRRRTHRRPLGGQSQGRAGRLQARLEPSQNAAPSSATTRCWRLCRSASSPSRARASPAISPTRPARWASRCGASARRAAPSAATSALTSEPCALPRQRRPRRRPSHGELALRGDCPSSRGIWSVNGQGCSACA